MAEIKTTNYSMPVRISLLNGREKPSLLLMKMDVTTVIKVGCILGHTLPQMRLKPHWWVWLGITNAKK